MAHDTHGARKQWPLSEEETLISFEAWRHNLLYRLNLDARFSIFLLDGVVWNKKSRAAADVRGLVADDAFTAAQKAANLDLMLQQVANFCPIISRRTIVHESTSIQTVWQAIKLHFGFQTTGGNFIDFLEIKFTPPERPETLYQRMLSFIENNLLTPDLEITHRGDDIEEFEDMSPTLENLIVLLWLHQIHHNLPNVVKQKYGADLRSQTLASLKPEISTALTSLIEEAKSSDARVMRSGQSAFPSRFNASSSRPGFNNRRQQPSQNQSRRPFARQQQQRRTPFRSCPLCKAAGRESSHFLSMCKHLPESDRKFLSKARQVLIEDEEDNCEFADFDADELGEEYADALHDEEAPAARCGRVNVRSSPLLRTFYEHNPLCLTIDTGAETNLIRSTTANNIRCPIYPSSQLAFQADGKSPLNVLGETHITLTRDDLELTFSGLIVDDLDVDILAGVPFMEENDIAVRPKNKQISIGNDCCFNYGNDTPASSSTGTRHRSAVLRCTAKTTVWPGDFLDVPVPVAQPSLKDTLVAVEPHIDSSNNAWPAPGIYESVGSHIRFVNTTDCPHSFSRHDHVALASLTFDPDVRSANPPTDTPIIRRSPTAGSSATHSSSVIVNPDGVFSSDVSSQFAALHQQFDSVFNPQYETYNHSFGKFEAVVNMGSVKPQQRKGRVPQYSRDKLVELQAKCDELDALGVLAKPETLDVTVEYLNPSFLVKKPNRANEFRFVTAFTEVGKYCKPQPSLMPNVNSTLRSIARWKHIVKTDLTVAFYQIPLSKESMKYCGIVTPFKGIRCYTRCAMGMPGSETALEELMCRVLGDLVEGGHVVKIADDLYCGAETCDELLAIWTSVLQRLHDANLKLRAEKTVIAPAKTAILGWIRNKGTLLADPHKVATLSTCSRPTTTKGLRSFIGAYKVLARVLPNCATFLQPLDRATHGKKSADKIVWEPAVTDAFTKAQRHLASNKSIVLPRESDQLWLITDGAQSTSGWGATLYALRDDKLLLAGFFSQQLSPSHVKWFPCEVEGIGIACAVKSFEGFIVQSNHRTQVLTDSKSCVDAYNRLLRGQFSSNARLSTFLSAACRHHIVIRHIAGAANLPSDFASRNPITCNEPKCQMCIFARAIDDCVVRALTVRDILDGKGSIPFTNRKAWLVTQSECRDLRRTKAHLIQGTRPTKKDTKIRSVKRYLNKIGLATDGLLVVRHCDPLVPSREAIVVPEDVLPGLLTALHLRLNHPSNAELSKIVKRYFWSINLDQALQLASQSCHVCASLIKVPSSLIPESSSDPPESVGACFAVDIMCRERQKILVIREYVSSFTQATIITSEKADDIRAALVMLTQDLAPLDGPPIIVRSDNAPGFRSLVDDRYLKNRRIHLDLGRIKNINKNPVAERAIQELEHEILRVVQSAGPVTPLTLQEAVASLNRRIRSDGLSAREILLQRDQYTGEQIPLNDRSIIVAKHNRALRNHKSSEISKAGSAPVHPTPNIIVGDLVYVYTDRDKNVPRSRYLVTAIDGEWCHIRKFIGETLRASSYKVKMYEVYKVPAQTINVSYHHESDSPESDSERDDHHDVVVINDEPVPNTSDNASPTPPPPLLHAQPLPSPALSPATVGNPVRIPGLHEPTSVMSPPTVTSGRSTRISRPTQHRDPPTIPVKISTLPPTTPAAGVSEVPAPPRRRPSTSTSRPPQLHPDGNSRSAPPTTSASASTRHRDTPTIPVEISTLPPTTPAAGVSEVPASPPRRPSTSTSRPSQLHPDGNARSAPPITSASASEATALPLRKSSRSCRPPSYLSDYQR